MKNDACARPRAKNFDYRTIISRSRARQHEPITVALFDDFHRVRAAACAMENKFLNQVRIAKPSHRESRKLKCQDKRVSTALSKINV